MNYKRIYDEFIQDRLSKQDFEGYSETHHILPKSLGGLDDETNLIRLTASDHLFAHCLLARVYKGKMIWALHRMTNRKSISINKKLRKHYEFLRSNLKISKETRKKMSIAQTGSKNGFYNKQHSDDTKLKLSKSHKGKILSKQHRLNIIKNSPTKVKVYQFSKSGELIKSYESINEAGRQTDCLPTHISRVCRGVRKSCNGFIWSYKNTLNY